MFRNIRSIPFIFVLCFSLSSATLAYDCSAIPQLTTEVESGKKYGLYINSNHIERTKQWSPLISAPPVSIMEASKAVEEWAVDRYAEFDRVIIQSISLNNYICAGLTARWYYQFSLVPVSNDSKVFGQRKIVALLFDKTIIEMELFRVASPMLEPK